MKHYQEAIEGYASLDNREILETTGVSTYQRIGKSYAIMGKFDAAIEFLEKAVDIEYDDLTVFELATILYDKKNIKKLTFILNSWILLIQTLMAMNILSGLYSS